MHKRSATAVLSPSDKPPAILLGRTLNVLGAVRGLARHGVRPIVITDSRQDPVFRSRYPIECHVVSPITDADLLRLLDGYRNRGLVIIATSDESVAFLGKHAVALEADFRFILPPRRVIDLFTDKRAETAAMQSLGVPLPKTVGRLPPTAQQLAEMIDFPLLIKPRSDADRGVLKAKNYAVRTSVELDAFYAAHGQHLDHVIAQEIIPGGDDHLWGCNCVFGHDSRLLQVFTFNRLGTTPPHYGVTSFAISKANNEIIFHAEKIGRLTDYVGPAMFEFKYDARDCIYKYLETNPRLGMTNFFDACCGVNNMAMIYDLALEGRTAAASIEAISSTEQECDVVFIDLFQDVISRLQDGERLGSILRRYGRYLGRRRVGAYWYWRDPLPALYIVARGVRRRIAVNRSPAGEQSKRTDAKGIEAKRANPWDSWMLAGVHRRLTNPTFYLKWSRNASRPLRAAIRRNAPVLATDFETPRRAEVYLAHPDDETFCGGLLCELVARGTEVHLHCLTRGEGGRTGLHRREDLARVREAEMRAAASELGAASVDFLGYVAPFPKRFRLYAPKVSECELASLIARRLCRSAADWVITHGSSGEYWHPGHVLLHRAVGRAWATLRGRRCAEDGRKSCFVTFNAWHEGSIIPHLLNRDDVPTLRLDVSAHAQRRIRMMMAHRSQATLLLSWAGSFERFVEQTNPEYYCIRIA